MRRENLQSVFQDLADTEWKLFYPILFCITRWIGIQRCAETIAKHQGPKIFRSYRDSLRDSGFGPRSFDPYKYKHRQQEVQAAEAGADDVAGEESDEETSERENEEAERLRQAIEDNRLDADGYEPRPQRFDTVQDLIVSLPNQSDFVDEEKFDEGDLMARGRKCKNLLNKNVGLTETNIGRCCYMAGVLLPYKILVEKLQVSKCPQQHLAARRIREFYMEMNVGWIGTDTNDPIYPYTPFQDWMSHMKSEGEDELVRLICIECRTFADILVRSVRGRLDSIWNYIQALELIDPLGPDLGQYATREVWDALKDLCSRRDVDFDVVQQQIIRERGRCTQLPEQTKSYIRHDLIGYCRHRHEGFLRQKIKTPTPELDKLRIAVFSLGLVSAFVESLFSKMSYNQTKSRSSLSDRTTDDILNMHDTVVADPRAPLDGTLALKTHTPSLYERDKMCKHIGTRVCKLFPTDDGEKRFHGDVTELVYHDIHARWMYRVTYSDGDTEMYWRNELELLFCKCDMIHED